VREIGVGKEKEV